MDHTTDEQLQSFVDREDSEVERAVVMRHVAACTPCHRRLEALEALTAEVSEAVAVLYPPPVTRPTLAVLEARARNARQTPPARRVVGAWPAPRAIAGPWLRAAAVVLAVAGVAGAATIVVQRGAADRAEPGVARQSEPAAPIVAPAPQVARSGVSVMPSAGRVVVAVRGAAAGTTIDVGVADAGTASAYVGGDGEGVRFSAQTGRIDVEAPGRAIVLDVRLPASATNATVEVDGRVRARKVAGRVRVERGDTEVDTEVVVRARAGRRNATR